MKNSEEKSVGANTVEEGNKAIPLVCCYCKKEIIKEKQCFGLNVTMCLECYDKLSYGE